MDQAKTEQVRSWLVKAGHDVASARKLADGDNPILDTAIYHCQQTVEKALKGYLVYCDQPFDKTHDLEILTRQAVSRNAGFAEWLETALELTPYATLYRYPGVEEGPEREEFEQAYAQALAFYDFVLSLLPALK
jgi:Uncharacterized conserved protein related to C-terminal domain of eukaryotic chaperone, SACSIN